jgi:hypothetical protein
LSFDFFAKLKYSNCCKIYNQIFHLITVASFVFDTLSVIFIFKNGLEAPDPVQSDRPSVATSKISTENDMRYDFEKTPKSIIPQSVTQIENETYHTDTIGNIQN